MSTQSDKQAIQPSQAQIIIIGGGIIGCSTAYHLAKAGAKDVLLIESGRLTNGSTWHAAGLVGQLRSSANITRLLGDSIALYQTLEQTTGLATGWKMNGGLRLACNRQRWLEVKRQATTAHSFGLEMELLTPKEALELWPLMDISDLEGAAFLPTDGQANPADITQSLAKGARDLGVKILENTRVSNIEVLHGRVISISTNNGKISCEKLVNCCGQWARQVGAMAGVNVPLQSMQHQYIVTEALTEVAVPPDLPTLRDPDRLTYFKEEVGGLVMGGYEPNPIVWSPDTVPEDFHFALLDENWPHFEPLMEQALARVPALQNAGVRSMINGPESFTPDGNFILGESPEVQNFFVGAGFNAFGIASGGGAGKALAEWVLGGEQPYDLWSVDIRRFSQVYQDKKIIIERTSEAYAKHYTPAFPHEEYLSTRGLLTSQLYDTLATQRACFGSKSGWERPNWFAPAGVEPIDVYSYDRQNWFDYVGQEHLATRKAVAVYDQSSFAKFEIYGNDAVAALQWICANDIDRPVGSVIYTQMLNHKGGIEADVTLTRLSENRYYLVTGTAFRVHNLNWVQRNLPVDSDVRIDDITEQWTTLSLMGPASRAVLSEVCGEKLDNADFPFGNCRTLSIGGSAVRALRITYLGELGWELHLANNAALAVYQTLMLAGKPHGIVNAGYRAIESLRLEKGYRAWGSDLTPDHTPLEAGLGFAVKLQSDIPFLGRDALTAQKGAPLNKRLATFTLDNPDCLLLGRETIYRNGEAVGYLSSGGWGYSLNTNIGLGYVRHADGVSRDWLTHGVYELDIAGERHACQLHLKPLYDPLNSRVKS